MRDTQEIREKIREIEFQMIQIERADQSHLWSRLQGFKQALEWLGTPAEDAAPQLKH